MNNHFSVSVEDYLKAIYELTQDHERASTNEIAEQMGVTPASATGMVQRLATVTPPLIDYQKHRGVSLTVEGKQTALEIIRHHRLLEAFLLEKLGFTWDEVDDEAERLEHVISEALEERISNALGDPSYDPHGDPIPTRELQMPIRSNVRMSELLPGDRATIQRINDADPDLLRYLSSIGLTPNTIVTILEVSPFDGNLHLQITGQLATVVLGVRVTSQIFVKPE
jgi:DtxR family Mn-dependent transcriptional regulator